MNFDFGKNQEFITGSCRPKSHIWANINFCKVSWKFRLFQALICVASNQSALVLLGWKGWYGVQFEELVKCNSSVQNSPSWWLGRTSEWIFLPTYNTCSNLSPCFHGPSVPKCHQQQCGDSSHERKFMEDNFIWEVTMSPSASSLACNSIRMVDLPWILGKMFQITSHRHGCTKERAKLEGRAASLLCLKFSSWLCVRAPRSFGTLSPRGWPTQPAKVLTSWCSFGGDGDVNDFLINRCLAFLGTKVCLCSACTPTTAPSSPALRYNNLYSSPSPKLYLMAAHSGLSLLSSTHPPTPHVPSQPTYSLTLCRPTSSTFTQSPIASWSRSWQIGEPLFLYCPVCSRKPHLKGVTTRSACFWLVTSLFIYRGWFLD